MGVEVVASHALEQADRQQRVPAEREEVVVAADPRPVEQLGPDPGVPWRSRMYIRVFARRCSAIVG